MRKVKDKRKFNIGLIQTTVSVDAEANLKKTIIKIKEAAKKNARI